jgi:hypothetical protein
MTPARRPPRLQLTRNLLAYLLIDLAGLGLTGLGGCYLAFAITPPGFSFPGSRLAAYFCLAIGFILLLGAVARLAEEIATQSATRSTLQTEPSVTPSGPPNAPTPSPIAP